MALKVPGYRVGALIGRGSQGAVYAGTVARSAHVLRSTQRLRSTLAARPGNNVLEQGQPVALKQFAAIPSGHRGTDSLRAARAEAALLAALDHPNLIELYDFVVTESDLILVTELAEGGSLAQLLRRRTRLSAAEVAATLSPIAAALAHVHDQGVQHGDVSAGNILFTADGDPKLADLGVARLIGQPSSALGTPAYLDPRVARGAAADAGSDVFALAAVGLHALTGAGPWWSAGPSAPGVVTMMGEVTRDRGELGLGAEAMIELARRGDLSDLAERLIGVPSSVSAPLLRALDVRGASRGSATDLALDLAAAALGSSVTLTAGRIQASGSLPPMVRERKPDTATVAGEAVADETVADETSDGYRTRLVVRDGGSAMGDTAGVGTARVGPVAQPDPAARSARCSRTASGRHAASGPATGSRVPVRRAIGRALHAMAYTRAWVRRRPYLAAVIMVLVVAGAAVASVAPGRNAHPAEAARGPVAGSRGPVAESRGPVAESRGAVAGSRGPAGSAGFGVVAMTALQHLDALRTDAFRRRDAHALTAVYDSAALLGEDVAQLGRLVPVGCGLIGLKTQFGAPQLSVSTTSRIELQVDETVFPARLACPAVAPTLSGHHEDLSTASDNPAPGGGTSRMAIVLVRSGAGWRISAQHEIDPTATGVNERSG
jgi:serine/threonine protein kinase